MNQSSYLCFFISLALVFSSSLSVEAIKLKKQDIYSFAIHPDHSKILFLSDEEQGRLFKSKNRGKSWDLIFKHPGADEFNKHGISQIAIAKSNPETIYIGFMNSGYEADPQSASYVDSFGIFKSIDGGKSWYEANFGLELTTLNILKISLNPENENELNIELREGLKYKSIDGANSWFLKTP